MRIGVVCGNQPRHLALLKALSQVSGEVFALQECTTAFPGIVEDFFRRSPVMQDYFGRVIEAERKIFGNVQFVPSNVRTLAVKMGDLMGLNEDVLEPLVNADVVVVFGSSYIKSPLVEHFIRAKAVNIHMGISPYYRGSSCNFWALYDGRADLVGATVHMLSKGLDSGEIIFHALPEPAATDPWEFTMGAVKAAIEGLAERIASNDLLAHSPVAQDRSLLIRYSRNAEFTDEVAAEFMSRNLGPAEIERQASRSGRRELVRPFVAERTNTRVR